MFSFVILIIGTIEIIYSCTMSLKAWMLIKAKTGMVARNGVIVSFITTVDFYSTDFGSYYTIPISLLFCFVLLCCISSLMNSPGEPKSSLNFSIGSIVNVLSSCFQPVFLPQPQYLFTYLLYFFHKNDEWMKERNWESHLSISTLTVLCQSASFPSPTHSSHLEFPPSPFQCNKILLEGAGLGTQSSNIWSGVL